MIFNKCPKLSICQEQTRQLLLSLPKNCEDCYIWKAYKQGFEDGATAMANAVNYYIQNDFAESLEREILYGRDK